MSTLNIMLQDRDAVTEFVAATTSMPFDMDLVQGSRVVDAKSLLGISKESLFSANSWYFIYGSWQGS